MLSLSKDGGHISKLSFTPGGTNYCFVFCSLSSDCNPRPLRAPRVAPPPLHKVHRPRDVTLGTYVCPEESHISPETCFQDRGIITHKLLDYTIQHTVMFQSWYRASPMNSKRRTVWGRGNLQDDAIAEAAYFSKSESRSSYFCIICFPSADCKHLSVHSKGGEKRKTYN